MNDKRVPIFDHSVSRSAPTVPLIAHAAAPMSPGAGLIAAMLLSLGLWGAIGLAVSSLVAAWPG
jgi:hypothetical protein